MTRSRVQSPVKDRENPSQTEVIGRCGEDDKTELPRGTDKSRTLNKTRKLIVLCKLVNKFDHAFRHDVEPGYCNQGQRVTLH